MYCSKCGNKIKETNNFCDKCGNKISIEENLNQEILYVEEGNMIRKADNSKITDDEIPDLILSGYKDRIRKTSAVLNSVEDIFPNNVEKYKLNEDEKTFLKSFYEHLILNNINPVIHTKRLSNGTINVEYKGCQVGRINLQGKTHTMQIFNNLYDHKIIEGNINNFLNEINKWIDYILNYLEEDSLENENIPSNFSNTVNSNENNNTKEPFQNSTKKKAPMNVFYKTLLIGFIFIGFMVISAILFLDPKEIYKTNETPIEVFSEKLIDVTQFSNISPKELIAIMGEPKEKEKWNYKGVSKTDKVTSYFYDKGEGRAFEFLIVKNKVIRFKIITNYYKGKQEPIKYKDEADIFNMFGLTLNETVGVIGKSSFSMRFSPVSDKVADVWIPFMDGNKNEITEIRFTYNLNYLQ